MLSTMSALNGDGSPHSPSSSSMSFSSSLVDFSNCLSTSSSSISSSTSTFSNDSITPGTTEEFTIHLMFYNSIKIISPKYKKIEDELFYKITSFDMNYLMENHRSSLPLAIDEESMGMGNEYPMKSASMNGTDFKFTEQPMYGLPLQKNEFIMFRSRMPITDHVAIQVDLYRREYTPGLLEENTYTKIGFCYIYPLNLKESNGFCFMPITSQSGKIVAHIKAEYFVAKPYNGQLIEEVKVKSKIRNPKNWLIKNGLDIGHRGAGCARRNDHNEKVLENTVDSFNFAFKKGADMVELDVQLSKDKIPIVYHDFNVNIVLQKKDFNIETLQMNIKDLTFSQLQMLKLNPVLHGKEVYDFEMQGNNPHSQPFASFRTVLESVDPECGFNVEIKYPQKKINGQWEAEKSHDLNEYVDLILQDLFLYAGERNILISSFHPEICSLVKLKQERYPVLFLTQGLTSKWMQFENPLNHSIEMATYLAVSMDLYGIAVHAEDIINNSALIKFVKSKSLILFCWGEDLNDRDLIKNLKKQGVDGAIYDKIDLLVAKEDQIQNGQLPTLERMDCE